MLLGYDILKLREKRYLIVIRAKHWFKWLGQGLGLSP